MQTKAENTKERKREEKERKGDDFSVFFESTVCALHMHFCGAVLEIQQPSQPGAQYPGLSQQKKAAH